MDLGIGGSITKNAEQSDYYPIHLVKNKGANIIIMSTYQLSNN